MIKEKKMKIIENYEKLYEELKIKYENKEKENEQLKTLLKLRDKEIISLKKKIKSANNSIDGNDIYNNNNIHEISQKYLEDLIKMEIENIQKEKLLYRNKVLTLENYELQYLAPKLTTGSNHNYQFSSSKLSNRDENNNINNLYLNMKYDMRPKNKIYSNKNINNKNGNGNIDNENLNDSLDYKYNTFTNFYDGEDNLILNGSFSKTLTRSKRKFDV